MMKTLPKIGFVGAGFFCQQAHLETFSKLSSCQIVAIAEHKENRRQLVAKRYHAEAFCDVKDMLASSDVDGVVVVVNGRHTASVVRECLAAGKHVLSEKPMAHTVAQGESLVQLAEERDAHYVVGFMKRYDAGVRCAKRIIEQFRKSGELGNITYVRAHCFLGDPYQGANGHIDSGERASISPVEGLPIIPNWLSAELREDYGWFLNRYSHSVNLQRFLLGDFGRILLSQPLVGKGRLVVLEFGGIPVTLEAGQLQSDRWNEHVEVFFERGRLRLELPPPILRNVSARVKIWKKGSHGEEYFEPVVAPSWSFACQAAEFIQTISETGESVSSGKDSLQDLLIIEELWRPEAEHASTKQRIT